MPQNLAIRIEKGLSLGILFIFLLNAWVPLPLAQTLGHTDDFRLPTPGIRVPLSPEYNPPVLKGIKVHPENPFRFDFILDKGDCVIASEAKVLMPDTRSSLQSYKEQLKAESTKLIKYFLASLTVPGKDLWVNLSPYEKDRILPESFGLTQMGRDLLAEDYMLKQIMASLIYPEDKLGKEFWSRVYKEAAHRFGNTQVPVNTFNKVWILPEKAIIYENAKTQTAYVVEAKLKVMLEEDYLALKKGTVPLTSFNRGLSPISHALALPILRKIIIPQLTKEVNENKNFAQLRQVYSSLILATWYKKKIKSSILAQVYEDKNKVAGLGYKPHDVETIYQRYLQAFKKGVFNYIKEEVDPIKQEVIPRKYFSGGTTFFKLANMAQIVHKIDPAQIASGHLDIVYSRFDDAAMTTELIERDIVDVVDSTLSLFLKNIKNYTQEARQYFIEGKPQEFHELATQRRKNFSVLVQRAADDLSAKFDRQQLEAIDWSACQKSLERRLPSQGLYNYLTVDLLYSIKKVLFDSDQDGQGYEIIKHTARKFASNVFFRGVSKHSVREISQQTVETMMSKYTYGLPFRDIHEDARQISTRLNVFIDKNKETYGGFQNIEVLRPVFFRGIRAYIVGCIRFKQKSVAFIIPFLNSPKGVFADALLLDPNSIRAIFTSPREDFFVDTRHYKALVDYIHSIIPETQESILWHIFGFENLARISFVRQLEERIAKNGEHFDMAPGILGNAAQVFTIASFPFVFKVPFDVARKVSRTTADDYFQKYDSARYLRRGGRMLDTMVLNDIRLKTDLFEPKLLNDLLTGSSGICQREGPYIVFKHILIQEKVEPLIVYFHNPQHTRLDQERVAIDYGNAILEMLALGIFPGSIKLANFGVTSYGRVVHFDYDSMDDFLNFQIRDIPTFTDDIDEIRPIEDLVMAGPYDLFPSEILKYGAPPGDLRDFFMRHFADLFKPKHWQQIQDEVRRHTRPDFPVYPQSERFYPDSDGATAGHFSNPQNDKNRAMTTGQVRPGGIDLTAAQMKVQTQNPAEAIQFHLDSAQLAQWEKAPGLVPVIINIQPLTDIKTFLGIA